MSRASRDKGARTERGIVARLEAEGLRAERVPLSGSTRYQGNGCDVDVYVPGRDAPLVAEVKARGSGGGFVLLERWLSDADLLILKRDRADPIVVLPWSTFVELANGHKK